MSPGGITPATLFRTCVALLIFAALLAYVRAGIESRSAFSLGEAAQANGDWESAVLHHRHAAQWHAPFIGRSAEAVDALIAIGDERVDASDTSGALVAYRSARFAIMATRHLTTPNAEALDELHPRISALMAEQVNGGEADATRFEDQLEAYEDRRPSPALALGASVGFLAWLLALGMVAWRGFEPEGRVRPRPFIGWLFAALVFLATWLVCVRFA